MYREPARSDHHDLALLRTAWKRASAKLRRGVPLFVGLGAICAAMGVYRKDTGLAVFGVIFFLALAVLVIVAAKKTERSPAAVALFHSPKDVVSVRYYETSDSRGLFRTQWLEVRTETARVSLKVENDLAELVGALQRRCPEATFDVPQPIGDAAAKG